MGGGFSHCVCVACVCCAFGARAPRGGCLQSQGGGQLMVTHLSSSGPSADRPPQAARAPPRRVGQTHKKNIQHHTHTTPKLTHPQTHTHNQPISKTIIKKGRPEIHQAVVGRPRARRLDGGAGQVFRRRQNLGRDPGGRRRAAHGAAAHGRGDGVAPHGAGVARLVMMMF